MTEQQGKHAVPYQPSRLLKSSFEWASAAVLALVVLVLVFATALRMVNVDGRSMEPTLHNGDRLVISGLFYTPDYGDVVVLLRDNNTPLIKRVIGLPGDRIEIESDGTVKRNGHPLSEGYIRGPTNPEGMTSQDVPAGMIFVMGDNRVKGGSLDSRRLGCFAVEDVVGRVLLRLSPSFGTITNGE